MCKIMGKEDLTAPKQLKEVVAKHDFKFKKSLGQNFLVDKNILKKIVDGAQVTEGDVVLEVGPGAGVLTQALAARAEKVIAVELDRSLLPILEETLANCPNVEIVNADILKLDLAALMTRYPGKKWKVVANLPYYITTPVIMRFLEEKLPIDSLVVMVQKEVAERMVAKPGGKDFGMLSVSVQYYTEPKIVTLVPRTVFIPPPEVGSAVVKLTAREKPPVEVPEEKDFFRIVKAAFGQRRKTLRNALLGGLGLAKEELEVILEKADIEGTRRGETLSLAEFAELARTWWELKNTKEA